MDQKHISQEDLYAFQQDCLKQEEKEKFLEHICSCNYCSEQLASIMSGELLSAPRNMKENILKATKRPEIQLAIKAEQASKQMQLFLYSLKVGTATVGALLLLLLTMNLSNFNNAPEFPKDIIQSNENTVSLTDTVLDNMDTVSTNILDFFDNIIKMEVIDNDQKER
jgi:hypothetical protein